MVFFNYRCPQTHVIKGDILILSGGWGRGVEEMMITCEYSYYFIKDTSPLSSILKDLDAPDISLTENLKKRNLKRVKKGQKLIIILIKEHHVSFVE